MAQEITVGGGGEYVPTFYSGTLSYTSLSSTKPLVISSSKKIRLVGLAAATSSGVGGVTVSVGSDVIIDNLNLSLSPIFQGNFAIGVNVGGDSQAALSLPFLQTLKDGDSITISTTSSGGSLLYSFSEVTGAS